MGLNVQKNGDTLILSRLSSGSPNRLILMTALRKNGAGRKAVSRRPNLRVDARRAGKIAAHPRAARGKPYPAHLERLRVGAFGDPRLNPALVWGQTPDS